MASGIHPITGRNDRVRQNSVQRERIRLLENSLGYVICGKPLSTTGEPCTKRPLKGEHRCKMHYKGGRRESANGKCKYPPRVGYGMNLNTFVQCHRCKDDFCKERITDKDIIDAGEDECPIEREIYKNVMELSDKYLIEGDYLQTGMLESVAYVFIKRWRAEKSIAEEGMLVDDIVGFDNKGGVISNKRAHQLLKPLSEFNKELIQFSKALVFSPDAIKRQAADEEVIDGAQVITEILKKAHKSRMEDE